MANKLSKKILIAPLDWGLGHASRCIPLINHLQKKGHEVIIASDGAQLSLLKQEFPGIEFIKLKGYNVNYTRYKRLFRAKILWQIPKILLTIRKEHDWLEKTIIDHNIDLVISDNRYGLYSNKIPCIFITHQLNVKAPFKKVERQMQKMNYRFINRFTECWVPDFEGEKNIAGLLSHPTRMPAVTTKYIGPLSRFKKLPTAGSFYKYFFVLSGPEPQRTVLEQAVFKIIPQLNGKVLVVRGKPNEAQQPPKVGDAVIKNHFTTADMHQYFLQSEYIISRSGYTTVMELLSLEKKSILIPTHGQTEQEYLAKRLMKQQWCYYCNQDDDLLQHIKKAEKFNYYLPKLDAPLYEKMLDEFLNTGNSIL